MAYDILIQVYEPDTITLNSTQTLNFVDVVNNYLNTNPSMTTLGNVVIYEDAQTHNKFICQCVQSKGT